MFSVSFANGVLVSESDTMTASGFTAKIQTLQSNNEMLMNYAKDMSSLVKDFILSLENYRDRIESQCLRDDFSDIVNALNDEYSKAVAPYQGFLDHMGETEKDGHILSKI
jgi:hypothetical protein